MENSLVPGRKYLQVALDMPELEKAIMVMVDIVKTVSLDNVIVEAGTPLVKAWGTIAVRMLREAFNAYLVADTKTMDTGSLEARIMYEAGANMVTVLGVAPNETLEAAIKEARRRGRQVAVDMIAHPDPVKRAREAAEMGADMVIMHIGIDVQVARGVSASELLREITMLRRELPADTLIGVAGGIKPGDASALVAAGADVIIVGGAITRSEKPGRVAEKLLEEIMSTDTGRHGVLG